MIYLDLLLGFLKVGLFSFGGAYSAIPLIRDIVLSYGWLGDEELSVMIAISESSPGPIMINLATYVGSSQGGILGAIVATTSVILPSFFIILFIFSIAKSFLDNKYVQAVIEGLKPCIIGIILATGIDMIIKQIVSTSNSFKLDIKTVLIAMFLAILLYGSKYIFKKQISPIMLIVVSAVCGIIVL